jgi:uncharacterized membrane protein YphA (DoxX/SURF4 family)
MKQKILFVASLLFGLMFINAGLNNFFNYMPTPDDTPESMIRMFTGMMEIVWLSPLMGVVQIVGGILFIIPRYRALGALIIFPVLVGIILTHITVEPSGLPMTLILLAIHIWVIVENREKYKPIIST